MRAGVTWGHCFWCDREDHGSIVLTPSKDRQVVYDPCRECAIKFALGVLLIEVANEPVVEEQTPLGGKFPTGRWTVVEADKVRGFIPDEALAEKIVEAGQTFMEVEAYNHLFGAVS